MTHRIIREDFLKGTNNVIALTLTEDGAAIAGAWTEVEISIGEWDDSVQITRTADGDGVALNASNGVLTINPGQLSEDLTSLVAGEYPVYVRVTDATNPDGAVFGGSDSTDRLVFVVSEPPA